METGSTRLSSTCAPATRNDVFWKPRPTHFASNVWGHQGSHHKETGRLCLCDVTRPTSTFKSDTIIYLDWTQFIQSRWIMVSLLNFITHLLYCLLNNICICMSTVWSSNFASTSLAFLSWKMCSSTIFFQIFYIYLTVLVLWWVYFVTLKCILCGVLHECKLLFWVTLYFAYNLVLMGKACTDEATFCFAFPL